MDSAGKLLLRRNAVLIEGFHQQPGYLIGLPELDLLAMQNEHRLAIAEERH